MLIPAPKPGQLIQLAAAHWTTVDDEDEPMRLAEGRYFVFESAEEDGLTVVPHPTLPNAWRAMKIETEPTKMGCRRR